MAHKLRSARDVAFPEIMDIISNNNQGPLEEAMSRTSRIWYLKHWLLSIGAMYFALQAKSFFSLTNHKTKKTTNKYNNYF